MVCWDHAAVLVTRGTLASVHTVATTLNMVTLGMMEQMEHLSPGHAAWRHGRYGVDIDIQ